MSKAISSPMVEFCMEIFLGFLKTGLAAKAHCMQAISLDSFAMLKIKKNV